MDVQEIIKLAVSITDENNSYVKQAARSQSFLINATDSSGTVDRFITMMDNRNANDWKNKFLAAGFTNVSVSPWTSSGNLSFDDVDSSFLSEISNRPKIGYSLSPTRKNPYAGTDVDQFSSDPRFGTHSSVDTNYLQSYLAKLMKEPKDKIKAGWYDGSILDWITKIVSLYPELAEVLDKQYPDIYSNSLLGKHLIKEKIDPSTYYPSELEIDHFGIDMYPLWTWLSVKDVPAKYIPYKLMTEELNKILIKAKSHKFHKQFSQPEMSEFYDELESKRMDREDKAAKIFKLISRGRI
jgi:hypothetical protein